jgi:hypothetical protein
MIPLKAMLSMLAEAPTLAVAHERLALASEELRRIQARVDELTEENGALRAQLNGVSSSDFARYRGVLWEKTANAKGALSRRCSVRGLEATSST